MYNLNRPGGAWGSCSALTVIFLSLSALGSCLHVQGLQLPPAMADMLHKINMPGLEISLGSCVIVNYGFQLQKEKLYYFE